MFGLFKSTKHLQTMLATLTVDLSAVRRTLDGLATTAGIHNRKAYPVEAAAFVYIVGWYAIQISELSEPNKHRFSAELTGCTAKIMSTAEKELETLGFIQGRMAAYRDAIHGGTGRDWAARLVFQFLGYLDAASPDHVPLQAALYAAVPTWVDAFRGFINRMNKSYTFV